MEFHPRRYYTSRPNPFRAGRPTAPHEENMSTITLYTVYHKAAHILQNPYITPIQVGGGDDIAGIHYRDNQGDNIAAKNDSYCELTAQYWMWKQDHESDYIGLMHYRRFFDFNTTAQRKANVYGIIEEPAFNLDFSKKYGLTPENLRAQIEGYDIILPHPWDVRPAGWDNLRHNYTASPHHHERDLNITRDVIAAHYPDYLSSFDEVMQARNGYFTNMFIMRRALFAEYSAWLFAVLAEVEKRADISAYDTQEKRVFGYLSERLLNVWLKKKLAEQPQLKINHLRRVFIFDTTAKSWYAQPVQTDKPVVSVVIASDDNYTPHLGALICSILDHFPADKYLDLIILDGGISALNRKLLMRLLPTHANIQFLELKDEFQQLATHMHFSRATFYRLILDKLIPGRDKVLYIDCDTIVLDDISTLFDTPLGDHAIGAVFDYIMHHFCLNDVLSIDTTGSLPAKRYLHDYVGLEDGWQRYFQAGVILFNMEKLRRLDLSEVMISDLLNKRYWFLDQDILNKYFLGDVVYLDPRWNSVNSVQNIYQGLPATYIAELKTTETDPKIIHYAGFETKPWNNRYAELAEYYFYYLRQTFWYEPVMFALERREQGNGTTSAPPGRGIFWRIGQKCWKMMPLFARRRLHRVKEYLKRKL
jgi:hypothetical protein